MKKNALSGHDPAVGEPAAAACNGRRKLLAASAAVGASLLLRPVAWAQPAVGIPDGLAAAIDGFTGGKSVLPGKVTLDISPIVDNGNSVPVTVTVNSPMTATDRVSAIAIFNERNPQRDVATFRLGPRAGRANVSTRIRLATSQKLVAVAGLSDGTFWSHSVEVVVALAACIE
jgi:sulfur-oxidizing protein SoxY